MPDIMGQMRDGRVLGIEVKKPGEKPTKEQVDFLGTININNGLADWCDSVEGALNIINGKNIAAALTEEMVKSD